METVRYGTAVLITLLGAGSASAAVEEIVITAQRRAQNLQDVPIAVSAFLGDDIGRLQIDTVKDIGTNVPNLQTYTVTANASAMQVFMRGAGVQNPGFNVSESPVGIYEDDVYHGRLATANLDLTDIERIEVLRGPQGTLYGRNTIAGAIKIVTRTPGDDMWFDASAGYGNYETMKLTTSVGGPLEEGKLGGSFSAMYNNRDEGYMNAPFANGYEPGEYNNVAARGKLHWYGTENFDAVLSVWTNNSDNDGYNGIPYGPSYDPASTPSNGGESTFPGFGFYDTLGPSSSLGYGKTTQVGSTLDLKWDFSDMEFRSITGWTDIDDQFRFDLNGGVAELVSGDPNTILYGVPGFYITSDGHNRSVSQEFHLQDTTADDDFDWIFGAFYMSEDGDQVYQPQLGFAGFAPAFTENTDSSTDTYALFAETTWRFAKDWAAIVGGRWSQDEKDYTNNCTGSFCTSGGLPTDWSLDLSKNFSEFTPRGVLEYTVSDDMMVYGSISKGFQAGGFQTLCFGNQDCASVIYEPQTVWSYDLGMKSDFLDDTLQVNAALFYAQYDDLQQTFLDNGAFPLGNVGEVDVWGAELETNWNPIENLNLFAILGYQQDDYGTLDPLAAAVLLGADELPSLPEFSGKVGFNHRFDLNAAWRFIYGADVYYSDSYYATADNALEIDSFARINGFLGVETSDDHWSIILTGTNITDEEDLVSGIAGNGTNIRTVQPPAEWMLTGAYRY